MRGLKKKDRGTTVNCHCVTKKKATVKRHISEGSKHFLDLLQS